MAEILINDALNQKKEESLVAVRYDLNNGFDLNTGFNHSISPVTHLMLGTFKDYVVVRGDNLIEFTPEFTTFNTTFFNDVVAEVIRTINPNREIVEATLEITIDYSVDNTTEDNIKDIEKNLNEIKGDVEIRNVHLYYTYYDKDKDDGKLKEDWIALGSIINERDKGLGVFDKENLSLSLTPSKIDKGNILATYQEYYG